MTLSCKTKANATKSFRIAEAPPVLTLHLKRFRINYNSWNGKPRADKYNQHIGFEEYLDIEEFMVDPKVCSYLSYLTRGGLLLLSALSMFFLFYHILSYFEGSYADYIYRLDQVIHQARNIDYSE